jgi:hypothetical protein
MPNPREATGMREVLILLRAHDVQGFESVAATVETLDGHVLHAYPPGAMIASIKAGKVDELLRQADVESVETDEIKGERLKSATGRTAAAIAAWNELVRAKRRATSQADLPKGVSWGAPGRLPPDPPAHVQEMLRRREREMQRGEDSNQDDPDSTD